MRKRLLRIAALLLGLTLTAGYARADLAADKKDPGKKETRKGKPGDACKTAADCDQGSRPQSCLNSKCQTDPMPPPPT